MICEGIQYKGYTINRNYCNCHPETCCCLKYSIFNGSVHVKNSFDIENAKKDIDNIIK